MEVLAICALPNNCKHSIILIIRLHYTQFSAIAINKDLFLVRPDFWVLGPWSWQVLGPDFWVLGPGSWVLASPGSWQPPLDAAVDHGGDSVDPLPLNQPG